MAGLKLKLRPEEQLMINGSIIQNGAKQVELTVKTPGTRILRLRDAIHPEEATTPVKRVCYIAQLAVAGEAKDEEVYDDFVKGVNALKNVFHDKGSQEVIAKALDYAEEHDFYKAMQAVRKLIRYEEALFSRLGMLEDMMEDQNQQDAHDIINTLSSIKDRLGNNSKHLS